MVYQPREDSFLLQRQVKRYAKGNVLDIGTGSGIQALTAAERKDVRKVLAADISKEAVEYCRKSIRNKKIRVLVSDLFSNVRGRFDTIIFNPPYLPADAKLGDLTIEGGKKGFETIQKFLEEANDFLTDNGAILLLISSFTNKNKVEELIKQNLFDLRILSSTHIFFEDLLVYKITKTRLLKELNKKGVWGLNYFAKGKRGLIFTGRYKDKRIAIKIKHPKSEAIKRMENEAKWLKILNKKGIGPKSLFSGKNYLAYEFVGGMFIVDALKKLKKNTIKKILTNVLDQCKLMDEMGIAKEEMHHPVKHIIITKNQKPVMIDFERTHKSRKTHNVTQFCQFIISGYLCGLLKTRGLVIDKKRMIALARNYKQKDCEENFKQIIAQLK